MTSGGPRVHLGGDDDSKGVKVKKENVETDGRKDLPVMGVKQNTHKRTSSYRQKQRKQPHLERGKV